MAILTAIVGAIVGALATYLIRRRFEKSTATIIQFQYYHSEKMVEARRRAWHYLRSDEFMRNPRPLDWFYEGEGLESEINKPNYGAIVQVLYFWYLLSVLHERGEIIPKLARQLLAYQFSGWKDALAPLLEATLRSGRDKPECLALLDRPGQTGAMGWIQDRY
jgi:hypothetical protein